MGLCEKMRIFFALLFVLCTSLVFGQYNMSVIKKDGHIVQFPVEDVDSVIFDSLERNESFSRAAAVNDVPSDTIWELGYYNSKGNKTASNRRVRTKNKIDSNVNYICVENDIDYYLLGWDELGIFVKYWDGSKFQGSPLLLKGDINISSIRSQHPGYSFAIYGVANDVAVYSSKFEFLSTIENEYDELKTDDYNSQSLWIRAYINSRGNYVECKDRIATRDYIDESIDVAYLTHNLPYYIQAFVMAYKADGTYVGIVQNKDFSISSKASNFEVTIPIRDIRSKYPTLKYKIVLHFSNNGEITVEDSYHCKFKNLIMDKIDKVSNNKPIITFIDDDGEEEQFENWKKVYDATFIRPTMALITSAITPTSETLIKRYSGLGFEFISHSHAHKALTGMTEQQLMADFEASVNVLRKLGISTANTSLIVYPYNYTDDKVINIANKFFQGGFEGGVNRVNGCPLDRFHIRRESLLSKTRRIGVEVDGATYECGAPKTVEEWKPIIDDLVGRNGWLVVMTHLRNRASKEGHYYFDDSFVTAIQEFVKYALSRGCEFLTAGEAFKVFQNKYEEGSISEGNYYIIDCNGKVWNGSK